MKLYYVNGSSLFLNHQLMKIDNWSPISQSIATDTIIIYYHQNVLIWILFGNLQIDKQDNESF